RHGVRRRGRDVQHLGGAETALAPETGPEMTSSAAGKIVLITGASRGIGAATARHAAAEGYDVAVNYLRDKAAAGGVVADIEAAGRRAGAGPAGVARGGDGERPCATAGANPGRPPHPLCPHPHTPPHSPNP